MQPLTFEWDSDKATLNLRVHGVSLDEASTVFGDPLSATLADEKHSQSEQRLLLIGLSANGRLLLLVHSERDERIRLISARRVTRREQNLYEQASS